MVTPADRVTPVDDGLPSERTTGRAAMWNYAVFALSKASTVIMTVVLARLLTPEDFGLFALALLMLNLFDFVRDFGVGAALVQRPEPWIRLAPTGLTLTLTFGAAMTAATVLLAPVISAALGAPALTPVVQVLAIGLMISSFATFPQSLIRRRMEFHRRLVPELVGAVVKMVVAITLAVSGLGVWSLVWAQLVGTGLTSLLYWIVARPRATLGLDRAVAVAVLRFGLPVTALSFLFFLSSNVPTAFIGRQLGSEQLGYYSLAYRLAELLVLMLCVVIGDVLFSALSRFQDDLPMLRERYLSALRLAVALTAPIGLGMAVVSEDLVAVVYGPGYASVAAPLAVLSVFVVLSSAVFHSGSVYKAIGRPALLTYLTGGWLLLIVPLVWVAAAYSIVWVAVALLAAQFVDLGARLLVVRSVLKLSMRRQLRVYVGPAVAAVVMVAGVAAAGLLVPGWPAGVRLAVLIPLGFALYAGALRVVDSATLTALVSAGRSFR